MKDKREKPGQTPADPQALRRRAEEQVRSMALSALSAQTQEEFQRVLHELRVHQIELEMQNEELRTAQAEIEAGRARYFDLYDLAPVGYCTLSEKGMILEANLTAGALLGAARRTLVKQQLSRFILKEDQDIYYLHRKQLFETGQPQECELRLVKPDGTLFWAHLTATAAQAEDGAPVCRVAISDITKSRTAEIDRFEMAERYRLANKATNDVIWDWDVIQDTQQWNEAGTAVFGWTEIVERPVNAHWWVERVHPDDRERVHDSFLAVVNNPESATWHDEYRFMKADGACAVVADRGYVLRDEHGRAIRMIGAMQDITERKRGEALLQRKERDLRESQRIAHVGSWRLDLSTNQVIWTEELYEMYGFNPSLPPPPYTEHMKLFTPESWERLSTALAATRDTGIPYTLELETVRKDGSNGWMWVRGEADVDSAGKTVALWGAAQDITDRKRSEAALKESEERYRSIFDNSIEGIFQTTTEGRYRTLNPAFARMFGYDSPAEMISAVTNIGEQLYVDPEDRKRLVVLMEASRGMVRDHQVRLLRKDGSVFWVSINARMVWYEKEGRSFIEGACMDITERKRVEEEKAQLQDQLLQAQKMESVGRLAGGVAHDFNNKLGVIIGYTEMALDQIDPTLPLHADLAQIRTAATQAADLTRQLLAFARKQTVAPKVLDLNITVTAMLKMLQRLIGENIHMNWQPQANLWPIKIDPTQIDQILSNLCVNARDAIANVGKITVETGNITVDEDYGTAYAGFLPGEYVLLAVSDNGCGMDKETLSRLFEPFFTTKLRGNGTGLGLATVYGIIKQNNGLINVYSEPDKGTTFRIYLPRHVGKTEQIQTRGPVETDSRGHETILLVEDESSILEMTTRMLKKQGYTVLSASTPGAAIRLARERAGEIHLLMTDVIMPEMNGRDLAKNLLSLYPHLKRLFMSGYTANVIAHHGVLDEGVYFIQKPFSIKELAAKVREALDQE